MSAEDRVMALCHSCSLCDDDQRERYLFRCRPLSGLRSDPLGVIDLWDAWAAIFATTTLEYHLS